MIRGGIGHGIMGGSDCFTIIGKSGVGKSAAIARSLQIITENKIIETQKPYCRIIPAVVVQCAQLKVYC